MNQKQAIEYANDLCRRFDRGQVSISTLSIFDRTILCLRGKIEAHEI